jgi:hypothetical protein
MIYSEEITRIVLHYRVAKSHPRFFHTLISGLALLLLSLGINNLANAYVNTNPAGVSVQDILLDHLPYIQLNDVYLEGFALLIGCITLLGLHRPQKLPFLLKTVALFITVRSFFMILTHLSLPLSQQEYQLNYAPLDGFMHMFSSGNDLFFSGASGLQTYTLNLGAATRDDLLQVQWYGNGTQVDGPAYLLWQSGDDTAKTAGLQYTSLIGRGGQGLYEYIQCMQKSSAAITEIMDFIAGAQNNTVQPMMLFCINSGLNDRNDDGIQSLGPNGTLDCSTPAGYADNMRGIIITIQNAWALNGYPRSNLFFLLQPSHPISNPDDAELIGYRAALSALTSDYQNCAVQNLAYQPLNTTLQANAAAWYNAGGGDTSHMTQTGYEQFCTLWVKELLK